MTDPVDAYRAITLKKGTVIYAGHPGQSHFYTTASGLSRSGGTVKGFNEGLQVMPHKLKGYRGEVQAYRVTEDVSAAFGKVSANPQHGAGGLPQVVVKDFGSVLEPVGTPIRLK